MSAQSAQLMMSGTAESQLETSNAEIDKAIQELRDNAESFARLDPASKASIARETLKTVGQHAQEWVNAGAKARGLTGHLVAEEWLAGPITTARHLRLAAESLEAIASRGRPPLGRGSHMRPDGHLQIDVFPASALDKVMFSGISGYFIMQEGIDQSTAIEKQAAFYKQKSPSGHVSLVLGAGNNSSIGPMDVFTKLFNEGSVCLLKMNPVNEWSGPPLEKALKPLIDRGYLRIVYGGVEVGKYTCGHDGIDDIHITGAVHTHDIIVWGPPGPERERRKKENDPLLKKPISSELGNISPVAIVPCDYSDAELDFQAQNLVSMVANNGSFNCNAAKLLVTAKGWKQRDKFMELLTRYLADAPTRKAYYPGAFDRYEKLTEGRDVQKFGEPGEDKLQWALIRDIDADDPDDPVFNTEPFCGILSHVEVSGDEPTAFLEGLVPFLNDRIWGTLNACIIIEPKVEKAVSKELDKAILELRYGTVAINHWPALAYGLGTTAWGGHPSATLDDIQSGLGWVHNTYMIEGLDKCVIRGNIRLRPKPLWFYNNYKAAKACPKLLEMELNPSWLKLPGLILSSI